MPEIYFTEDELKHICDTMHKQIGWNAMACVGAHNLRMSQKKGPGFATLQIKTSNCATPYRVVEVTLDTGRDLYIVEGIDPTLENGQIVPEVVFKFDGAFFDTIGDLVIEAADFKEV
jgi:hypothetical protein